MFKSVVSQVKVPSISRQKQGVLHVFLLCSCGRRQFWFCFKGMTFSVLIGFLHMEERRKGKLPHKLNQQQKHPKLVNRWSNQSSHLKYLQWRVLVRQVLLLLPRLSLWSVTSECFTFFLFINQSCSTLTVFTIFSQHVLYINLINRLDPLISLTDYQLFPLRYSLTPFLIGYHWCYLPILFLHGLAVLELFLDQC